MSEWVGLPVQGKLMTKLLGSFVVAMLFVAAPARAATFTLDSYTVKAHTTDPGLVLYANNLIDLAGLKVLSFDLSAVGQSETFELFTLGTKENALNGDDLIPYDIEVDFDFTEPLPGFGGEANGITGAGWFLSNFGYVAWDNPAVLAFGSYGLLGVTLENATFGLPGSTKIDATFTLLRADRPTAVPEPSSAMLFGFGALAMGAIRRRRTPAVQ